MRSQKTRQLKSTLKDVTILQDVAVEPGETFE